MIILYDDNNTVSYFVQELNSDPKFLLWKFRSWKTVCAQILNKHSQQGDNVFMQFQL